MPVYAVKDRADAEALRVLLCRLRYDGEFGLTWEGFTGEYEQLEAVSAHIDAEYRRVCARRDVPYAPHWKGLADRAQPYLPRGGKKSKKA